MDEQCRLNGSGASRELALIAEVQELKRDKRKLLKCLDNLVEKVMRSQGGATYETWAQARRVLNEMESKDGK